MKVLWLAPPPSAHARTQTYTHARAHTHLHARTHARHKHAHTSAPTHTLANTHTHIPRTPLLHSARRRRPRSQTARGPRADVPGRDRARRQRQGGAEARARVLREALGPRRAAPRRTIGSCGRLPLVAHPPRPRSAGDAGWLGQCWPARPSPGHLCGVKLLTSVTALALALSHASAGVRECVRACVCERIHTRGCRRWRQRTRWRRQAPASSSCAIRCKSHA